MNPKTKKMLFILGFVADAIVTVLLFVFSIVILVHLPKSKYDYADPSTLLGWFQADAMRILFLVVLPLSALLVLNVSLTIWYIKKTGKKEEKKQVSLNDLSDEEKAALKQKILQEMMQQSNESK